MIHEIQYATCVNCGTEIRPHKTSRTGYVHVAGRGAQCRLFAVPTTGVKEARIENGTPVVISEGMGEVSTGRVAAKRGDMYLIRYDGMESRMWVNARAVHVRSPETRRGNE